MNKRGVTPLIATLMLISFSVGLGAIVMSWGQHYIEEKAEFITATAMPIGCDPVSVSLIDLGGVKQLCIAPLTRTIRAFLENGPDAAIENLKARIVGTDGVDDVEPLLGAPLGRAASGTATFSYKPIGTVRQIKLTPYITIDGKKQYCERRSITAEEPLAQCG